MTTGYFKAEPGLYRRPYIDVLVTSPDADDRSFELSFVIDTGADLTLVSSIDGQRLCRRLGVDLQSLARGGVIGGIGGAVQTKVVKATLVIGSYRTTMDIPIIDTPPSPYDMPSLIGRDIIYDFALFMEHSADRLRLLRTGEEIIPLLES